MTLKPLIEYFSSATLPETLQLSESEFVKNLPKMIDSHISFLKGNSGKTTFMPYFERLVRVFEKVKT